MSSHSKVVLCILALGLSGLRLGRPGIRPAAKPSNRLRVHKTDFMMLLDIFININIYMSIIEAWPKRSPHTDNLGPTLTILN